MAPNPYKTKEYAHNALIYLSSWGAQMNIFLLLMSAN